MRSRRFTLATWFLALACVAPTLVGPPARADGPKYVVVPKAHITVDDGDTIAIAWPDRDAPEVVRILGIDAPEVRHVEHGIPYDQPFGREATGFLRGCLAVASKVELLRSPQEDPFGRTLAYVRLDGKNYSVLAITARLAVESVSHFGDNGLPGPAKAVLDAAAGAGPVAFEAPYLYRRRMGKVAALLEAEGTTPAPKRK